MRTYLWKAYPSTRFSVYISVRVSVWFPVTPATLNAPPNSDLSSQWILCVQKFYLLSFMWYLTCRLSFYELNQYCHLQINKNGFFGSHKQFIVCSTVLSVYWEYLVPSPVLLLFSSSWCTNHNKDPAINCFGAAFCTCAFALCTVHNYLSMNPSPFPPRRSISSHLLLNWLESFFVCV